MPDRGSEDTSTLKRVKRTGMLTRWGDLLDEVGQMFYNAIENVLQKPLLVVGMTVND